MNFKKISIYLCCFFLLVVSAMAVDLNIVCAPATVGPEEATACILELSEAVTSISSVDFTINTGNLFSLASITDVPDQFTATPNLNTKRVLISTPQLELHPTTLGTLNLLAGHFPGQTQVTLTSFEMLDDMFSPISVTVNPSNTITIPAAVAAEPEICDDGLDNDGDGATDCADADCAGRTGPNGLYCCQADDICDIVGLKLGLVLVCQSNECVEEAVLPIAGCGDGVAEAPEECDDGNTASGDGCSATCTIEAGYTCTGRTPSICTAAAVPEEPSTILLNAIRIAINVYEVSSKTMSDKLAAISAIAAALRDFFAAG